MEKGPRGDAAGYGRVDGQKPLAACRVLDAAAALSPRLSLAIAAVRVLTDAYVSLALTPTRRDQRGMQMPFDAVKLDRWLGGVPGAAPPAAGTAGNYEAHGQLRPLPWLFSSAAAAVAPGLTSQMPVVTATHADALRALDFEEGGSGGGAALDAADAYALPVTLSSLGASWTIAATGISLPMVLDVVGSDGNLYRQIIKATQPNSTDDTRQDAVMQQLFGVVNACLRSDAAARARRLRVRTYKVVPLTATTGILEFVGGTLSMSAYLVEQPYNARARFAEGEMTHNEARALIDEAHKRAKKLGAARLPPLPSDPRVLAMAAIMAVTGPVLHHFFGDMCSSPERWAAARLAYARSTATASFVGYVAGIGDRHVSNILLDASTGEVVHIDFGLAMEQGRLLPTPEQVTFRLTRDVVAALGVTGTAGTFSRCAEAVMRVMRGAEATLLAVLSVLIHDPLYRWAMGPDRARRIELRRGTNEADTAAGDGGGGADRGGGAAGSSSRSDRGAGHARDPSIARVVQQHVSGAAATSTGADDAANAARVLHRLRQKLLGLEYSEATGVALDVPQQVQRVTEEHQELVRFALIFGGWQAYL